MERIRTLDPTLPVLVMTAWSSVAGAVEAMRRGARDYIEKPWDDEQAAGGGADADRAAARGAAQSAAAGGQQRACSAARRRRSSATRRSIVDIRQTIERIAPSDASVLITGEHGTGKEVVAAWLHALSDRHGKPLVTMNAGGLAEGIAESELFGHVKGAFTDARVDRIGCFEMADEGTLFLDEIANMPMRLQAKLLRVLQTGEMARVGSSRVRYVNVRVHLGDQRQPARGDCRRTLPRGSALPSEHRRHPPAAAARAPRRHRRAGAAFPRHLLGALSQADHGVRRETRWR